jgi:hypothetical protein
MLTRIILIALLCLPSFNASARDSLFYGVWRDTLWKSFDKDWGNILITEDKIYWGRKDGKGWRSDIDKYACVSKYEIDQRGKGPSFPNDSKKESRTRGDIFIYVRFKLKELSCDTTSVHTRNIQKDIGYLQFATGYKGIYGKHVIIVAYDKDEKKRLIAYANKIKHI